MDDNEVTIAASETLSALLGNDKQKNYTMKVVEIQGTRKNDAIDRLAEKEIR